MARRPRPARTVPPLDPPDVLPLRSQRRPADAQRESQRELIAAATVLGVGRDGALAEELRVALPSDGGGDPASAMVDPARDPHAAWSTTAAFFLTWDAWFQDELAQRDEALANAYLLGRGLAECYWGLGSESTWVTNGRPSAVSPAFLLGADRRLELSRMLSRLDPAMTHETSPAAISGSLEAWGAVARDEHWLSSPDLRATLYEQVRRWYQLVVLGQDPTTMVRPYAKLTGLRGIGRAARLFRPQLALFGTALALVTSVPGAAAGGGARAARRTLESLVRRRSLTTPTRPPPDRATR